MTAADDALRWARELYGAREDRAAPLAAALAQAEQLARIADALEGILDTLRPAQGDPRAMPPQPIEAWAARGYGRHLQPSVTLVHPLVGRRVRVARGNVLPGMRGAVVAVDTVAGVLCGWVDEPDDPQGAIPIPVGDLDVEDVAP